MACGCRKGGVRQPQGKSEVAEGVRGERRSRVAFFVEVDGVEQRFSTLREARVVADEVGTQVVSRRVNVA